ncbi:hypothetical protein BLSTO_05019 [Blastocystis sp. subtype 1]
MLLSKRLKGLQELNLSGNALKDEGFTCLLEALSTGCCPELLYLSVDDNKISAASMPALKALVESKGCPKLEAVSLNLNDLQEEGGKLFAEILSLSPVPWCRINLNENHIGNDAFDRIMEAIDSRSEFISEITLSQSGLSSEKLSEFGALLSKNKFPNLTVLDLSYNYSDDMLGGLLEGFAAGNTLKLRKLIISGMCMEADGCAKLSGIIRQKVLPELQELYIAENNITQRGVLAILLALRDTSCPVRVLDLSWNNLTDEGAKYIINFLNGKSKTSLAVMCLNQNDIAFKITDLQRALNQRNIRSPNLREQWL